MNTEIDRKIAVILVADVVGYSKHMEKDENATIKNYSACEKILNNLLKKYKGSVFNTGGDSVLVEFPSAVNAVECGVVFQNEIKKRNASDKTDIKLEFRIGINMGDVVNKDGNLIGDGVNIAARLEALAQPNGITISKSVYDFVVPKTKMTFNDLGVQKVKQNEFHAFDILLDPLQKRRLNTKPKLNLPTIGAIVLVVLIGIIGFIYFTFNSDTERLVDTSVDNSIPTILVAPIKTSGLSDNLEGFGTGITESMISTLSTYKGVRILSSSTSFHANEANMTDEMIRDEYGVTFIISGSLQVIGENARLTIETTDISKMMVVSSKKRNFLFNDIFKVQDELSNELLKEMSLDAVVGRGQGENWVSQFKSAEDYTLFLNFREEWRKETEESHNKSVLILEKLKARNPNMNMSNAYAWLIFQKFLLGLSKDKEKDLEKLRFYVEDNLSAPNKSDGYAAKALIGLYFLNLGCEEAEKNVDISLGYASTVDTLTIAGAVYSTCGNLEKAIKSTYSALRLVPNDTGWFITRNLSIQLFKSGRREELYKFLSDRIDAEDMKMDVLTLFSVLEYNKGNKKKAESYWLRAKDKGYDLEKSNLINRALSKELAREVLEIISKIENT